MCQTSSAFQTLGGASLYPIPPTSPVLKLHIPPYFLLEEKMKKLFALANVLVLASLVLAACGTPATQAPSVTEPPAATEAMTEAPTATEAPTQAATEAATEAAGNDLLAAVLARGTLVSFTDPAYPPQSSLKANPQRTPGTKCAEDQKTLGELEGFDIDAAAAIAEKLGVEPCFVSPDWGVMIGGNWSDRWDYAVGSVTITPERAKLFYFSKPYYTTPAALFVNADNTTYTKPSDLSGKKIGVCSGCTYESYLNGTLVIPGVPDIDFQIKDADIKGYDTDSTAIEDLALGDGLRLDGVITAQPTGLEAIKNGRPIKQLGDPLYFEYLAPAFDRASSLDPTSLIAKVSEITAGLHADGTLKDLSMKYYGTDLTTAAAEFDTSLLNK
jgi:polar amino acid transport system substrate-binding protein